jgi:hypothetical protein
MQIDFATSGGANQELEYRADTETLPEQEAKEILRLVESSGAFEREQNKVNSEGSVGRTDVISYRLSLADGNRQTTLWLNDVDAPASIRPLLSFLRERALEQKNAGK